MSDQLDNWREQAACKGEPTSLWFPGQNETANVAKAICAGCPVRAQCRSEGEWELGIWGGDSLRQRRDARRQPRQLKPCGSHAAFVRHKAAGEDPCDLCRLAESCYQREWNRANRASRAS